MISPPPPFPLQRAVRCASAIRAHSRIRLTYVGELGWELYIPTSFAQSVYDQLIEAGKAHGLRHCGYHTLNSLRIEKAYRDWPHDIGPADSPLEAGLGFTCDLEQTRRIHRSRGAPGAARCRASAAAPGAVSAGRSRTPAVPQRAHLSRRRTFGVRHLGHVRSHSRCRRCARLRLGAGRLQRAILHGRTLRNRASARQMYAREHRLRRCTTRKIFGYAPEAREPTRGHRVRRRNRRRRGDGLELRLFPAFVREFSAVRSRWWSPTPAIARRRARAPRAPSASSSRRRSTSPCRCSGWISCAPHPGFCSMPARHPI